MAIQVSSITFTEHLFWAGYRGSRDIKYRYLPPWGFTVLGGKQMDKCNNKTNSRISAINT